jgi:transposase
MAGIDWEWVKKEGGKGATIKQVAREVAPETGYVPFWRAYQARCGGVRESEVTIRLSHKPGEKAYVDFCDGIEVVEATTGKRTKTELFVGVLPFSSYTFAEFVPDQKLQSFIGVQERMFADFGGVTSYVVVDNLKSGVTRAHLYDPDTNPTYCDFAGHMGCAVMPARPYHPKDKAAVETAVGVIQRSFFQEVRNRTFYSLADLNTALRAYLERLNREVMKDHGVSRIDRRATELATLKVLPPSRFEFSEWRTAKVHPDCHIQVAKNFYSVPFTWVGEPVRVRMSEKMVEIFSQESQSLAVHARLEGTGKFSTMDGHYPEAKASLARFDIHHAQAEAAKIGNHVTALVDHLLSGTHPLRHLRRVQGILRLAKSTGLSPEALNHACKLALSFKKLRLVYIKECAVFYQQHGNRPQLVAPERPADAVHLYEGDPGRTVATAVAVAGGSHAEVQS